MRPAVAVEKLIEEGGFNRPDIGAIVDALVREPEQRQHLRDRAADLKVERGTETPAPQNLAAEESVLSALLLAGADGAEASARVAAAVRAAGLTRGVFYRATHGAIYDAAVALANRGGPSDVVLVAEELRRRGELESVGGATRLHELAALATTTSNAAFFAAIVVEAAANRDLQRIAREMASAALNGGVVAHPDLLAQIRDFVDGVRTGTVDYTIDGATFVADAGAETAAVWGAGDAVAWAKGEPLMIAGSQGAGKTTIAQQLALARAGVREPLVLGMPVEPDERCVLYVAADRPKQIARSLRRMVTDADADELRARLKVWPRPLPFDVVAEPHRLALFAVERDAGTLVLDSLKDLAPKLSDEETGGQLTRAIQAVVAAGVEIVVLHHQRKSQGDNKKPNTLADVYGSGWLTAGMGSVLLVWGDPGDILVELRHLKQPVDEIGPLEIRHDHASGTSTLAAEPVDLEQLLLTAGTDGLTVKDAAAAIYGSDASKQQIEKARRRLGTLVDSGRAQHIESLRPGTPGTYYYTGPGAEERDAP